MVAILTRLRRSYVFAKRKWEIIFIDIWQETVNKRIAEGIYEVSFIFHWNWNTKMISRQSAEWKEIFKSMYWALLANRYLYRRRRCNCISGLSLIFLVIAFLHLYFYLIKILCPNASHLMLIITTVVERKKRMGI